MHTQSQASGLQLQDVDMSNLDTLVLDYLAAEDFVEVRQEGQFHALNAQLRQLHPTDSAN